MKIDISFKEAVANFHKKADAAQAIFSLEGKLRASHNLDERIRIQTILLDILDSEGEKPGSLEDAAVLQTALLHHQRSLYEDIAKRELNRAGFNRFTKLSTPDNFDSFPLTYNFLVNSDGERYDVSVRVNDNGSAEIEEKDEETDPEEDFALANDFLPSHEEDFEDEELSPSMSNTVLRETIKQLILLDRVFENFHPENEKEGDFNRAKVQGIREDLESMTEHLTLGKTVGPMLQRIETIRTELKYSWEDLEPSISRNKVEGILSEIENNLFKLQNDRLGSMEEPEPFELVEREDLSYPSDDVMMGF